MAATDFATMEAIPAILSLTVHDGCQVRVEASISRKLLMIFKNGAIVPTITRTFNMIDIITAHRFMESNSGAGKIVVLT